MQEKQIPCENRIFVNRTLNMNSIKMIGFDMDYTLVTYNVPEFEKLAYEIVKSKLIKDYGYPKEIQKLEFDPDFIIRGLVIDTEDGNFLKVNRYGFVRIASHGTRFFSFEEQKKIFGAKSIDFADSRFYIVHTLFSLAEGCLYAQLIDYYDDANIKIDYRKLFTEVRKSLNDSHQDDELKGEVVKQPEKYLLKDKRIFDSLLKFRKYGKKVAMITNSDYEYSNKVMSYCFGDFSDTPWQDLFDLIIVTANKPGYFLEMTRYLKVDRDTGYLSNFYGQIEWGGIYQGGNAQILKKHLKLHSSEILYLGDHILGDVVTLKETTGWRTGLVVQELAQEVPILYASIKTHEAISKRMKLKEELETQTIEIKEKYLDKSLENCPEDKVKWDKLKSQISKLDSELTELILQSQEGFNRYWGEVMRAGNELSRFATIVERYACIYMSGIANLYYYSPFKYYRSTRRLLAHDPQD